MKRTAIIAFLLSAAFALIAFFGSDWVEEENHGWYMLTFVTFLSGFCVAAGIFKKKKDFQICLAFGVVWGFMLALAIAISIMNRRISIDFVTFPIGLIVTPVGFFLLSQVGSIAGSLLEPVDPDNTVNPPENSKNQLDD